MKALRSMLLGTMLVATVVADNFAQQRHEYTLRILTYNIYHGETTDGRVDMELFASIIREGRPDLVALQEVDKNAKRTGVIDITEELSKRTGLKGYFVKHRDFQGGEYGNAILSRFPVADVDVIKGYRSESTNTTASANSGITIPCAKVTLAEGSEIVFTCTHLSTKLEDRQGQARQLMDYYIAAGRPPMIITGDLNAEPQHDEIKMLLKEFAESDTDFRNTFSTRSGLVKKIDYVLYPRNDHWQVLETKVICREDASDHCAFLAVIRYTP